MLNWTSKTSISEDYRPKLNFSSRLWLAPFVLILGVTAGLIISRGWIYCLAFCVLCLLLLWPIEVGLGFYVLFLPFEPISMVGNQSKGISITWVLGIVAGLAVLGAMIVRGRFRRPPRAALWWSLLALWGTISAAWAIDPELSLKRLPTIFSLLLLFLICSSTRFTERELKMLALLSIAGACLAATYISFVSRGAASGADAIRGSLSMGQTEADPNDVAASFLLPLALAMGGFLLLRSQIARLAMLAAFGLISYAVLLTMSRGAIIALVVMTIVFVWYGPRRSRRRLIVPAALFGIALLVKWGVVLARLTDATRTGGAGRLDIWIAGVQAIKQHGLLGAGLDNFPLAYNAVAGYAPQFRGMARASHNIFLGFWVELGLPGLLLFGAAVTQQLRAAKQILKKRSDPFSGPVLICYAACWSVLAAGFFLDIEWRKTFWLSWTFLVLAIQFRKEYLAGMLGPSHVGGV